MHPVSDQSVVDALEVWRIVKKHSGTGDDIRIVFLGDYRCGRPLEVLK